MLTTGNDEYMHPYQHPKILHLCLDFVVFHVLSTLLTGSDVKLVSDFRARVLFSDLQSRMQFLDRLT